jgi:hypothetical protein
MNGANDFNLNCSQGLMDGTTLTGGAGSTYTQTTSIPFVGPWWTLFCVSDGTTWYVN